MMDDYRPTPDQYPSRGELRLDQLNDAYWEGFNMRRNSRPDDVEYTIYFLSGREDREDAGF